MRKRWVVHVAPQMKMRNPSMKTSKQIRKAMLLKSMILLMKVRVAGAERVMEGVTQKCRTRMQMVLAKKRRDRKRNPRSKKADPGTSVDWTWAVVEAWVGSLD